MVLIGDRSSMRNARGRRGVWRTASRAAEEARDGQWVEETQRVRQTQEQCRQISESPLHRLCYLKASDSIDNVKGTACTSAAIMNARCRDRHFASPTGNFNLASAEHLKMKNNAFVAQVRELQKIPESCGKKPMRTDSPKTPGSSESKTVMLSDWRDARRTSEDSVKFVPFTVNESLTIPTTFKHGELYTVVSSVATFAGAVRIGNSGT